MPKTTVINDTGKPLTLKEGTAGIFTTLKKLKPKGSYTIVVDTNATYREYWCAVKADDPDGGVVLSSDDCEDLKQVTIIEVKRGNTISYSYNGLRRDSGEATTEDAKSVEDTSNFDSEPTEDDVEPTKHGRWIRGLLGIFTRAEKGPSSKSQAGNSGGPSAV